MFKRLAIFLTFTLLIDSVAVPLAHANLLKETKQPISSPKIIDQSPAPTTVSLSLIPHLNLTKQRVALAPSFGEIVETHPQSQAGRMIYHIQDVHDLLPAQINLSEIITALEQHAKDQNKKLLVAVEGAAGEIETDSLSAYSDEERKRDVSAALLKSGFFMGEDYAAVLNNPGRIKIVGVETPSLYRANVRARDLTVTSRQAILATIRELRKQLETLKPHNFNSILGTLERNRLAAEAGTLGLTEHVKYLDSIDHNRVHQRLSLIHLLTVAELESKLNFKNVEEESKKLLSRMVEGRGEKGSGLVASRPDPFSQDLTPSLERLLELSHAYKRNQITALSYYSYLLNSAKGSYPAIKEYVTYLRLAEEVNSDEIFDDVTVIETAIAKSLLKHSIPQDLYLHLRWLERQEKFFSLSMIPREWKNQGKTDTAEILTRYADIKNFIEEQKMALGYQFFVPTFHTSKLKSAVKGARHFYVAAEKRDTEMVKNLVQVLSHYPSQHYVVAFVAGGFHTDGIKRELKKHHLAYSVIRPQIETSVELSDKYSFPKLSTVINKIVIQNQTLRHQNPAKLAGGPTFVTGIFKNPGVTDSEAALTAAAQTAFASRGVIPAFAGIQSSGSPIKTFGGNIFGFLYRAFSFIKRHPFFVGTAASMILIIALAIVLPVNGVGVPPVEAVQAITKGSTEVRLAGAASPLALGAYLIYRLAQSGNLSQEKLALIQDYAALRNLRLQIVDDIHVNNLTPSIDQKNKILKIPQRYVEKKRIIPQAKLDGTIKLGESATLGPNKDVAIPIQELKDVLPPPDDAAWNGGVDKFGLPLNADIKSRYAKIGDKFIGPTDDRSKYFVDQNSERDKYYAGILLGRIRDPKFQDRFVDNYIDFFDEELSDLRRSIKGEYTTYTYQEVAILTQFGKKLPQYLIDWYRISHDENESLDRRHLATIRLRALIEFVSAVPDTLDPEKTDTPDENRVQYSVPLPGIKTLFGQREDLIPEIHDPKPYSGKSFKAVPRKGDGTPLPADELIDLNQESLKDVRQAELEGKFVFTIRAGGAARRLGLDKSQAPALVTAENALVTIRRGGHDVLNEPHFKKLPMLARYILQWMAHIIDQAEKEHVKVELALANQTIFIEMSENNSSQILNYIKKAKFFGLAPHQIVFTEQEVTAGEGVKENGEVVQAKTFSYPAEHELEVGPQGHGDMEDRSRLPHSVFTIDGHGQRHYYHVSANELFASQGRLISRIQLSQLDATRSDYLDDLRFHALGLTGEKLGLPVARFSFDPTSTKGGSLFYFRKFPPELKAYLRTKREGGFVSLEPSMLKSEAGANLLAALQKTFKDSGVRVGVSNAAVTVVDPHIFLNPLKHQFLATVRSGKTIEKDGKKYEVNGTIHWDLWSYEYLNYLDTVPFLHERDRIRSEWKNTNHFSFHTNDKGSDGSGLPGLIEALVSQDDKSSNITFYALARNVENGRSALHGITYDFDLPISWKVFFGLALAIFALAGGLYNLDMASAVASASIAFVGVHLGLIGGVAKGVISTEPEAVDQDRDFAELSQDGNFDSRLLNVVTNFAKSLNQSGLAQTSITQLIATQGIWATSNRNQGVLSVGYGFLRKSGFFGYAIRRVLLHLALSHEAAHYRAPQFRISRSAILWILNEVMAWVYTVRLVITLLSLNFGASLATAAEASFATKALGRHTIEVAKKTDTFSSRLASLLKSSRTRRINGASHVAVDVGRLYAATGADNFQVELRNVLALYGLLRGRLDEMKGEDGSRLNATVVFYYSEDLSQTLSPILAQAIRNLGATPGVRFVQQGIDSEVVVQDPRQIFVQAGASANLTDSNFHVLTPDSAGISIENMVTYAGPRDLAFALFAYTQFEDGQRAYQGLIELFKSLLSHIPHQNLTDEIMTFIQAAIMA